MNTKVYVGNLAAAMTETDLLELFSDYGNVVAANILVDRENHKTGGAAIVTMVTPEGARSAIQSLNGKVIGSCALALSEARAEGGNESNAGRGPRRSPSYLY